MSFKHMYKNYYKKNIKKIKIKDAIGTFLAHDLTEIRPKEFKGTAFSAGYKIDNKDLQYLKQIGKRHLFVLDLNDSQIHENVAALRLANALSKIGILFNLKPNEGKIVLKANIKGLFKVNIKALLKLNMIPEVICVSIHNNTVVDINTPIVSLRILPLFIKKKILLNAEKLIYFENPIFEVKPFFLLKTSLIITGNEIYDGIVKDGFEKIIKKKLNEYKINLFKTFIVPDDQEIITEKIGFFLFSDTRLLIITGGMSVDPDDVTLKSIFKSAPNKIYYGASVMPGSMFQISYFGNTIVLGIPACALYHKTTIFDIIFPRLLIGEKPNFKDLAILSHGGMCMNCDKCIQTRCYFGKN